MIWCSHTYMKVKFQKIVKHKSLEWLFTSTARLRAQQTMVVT